MVGEAYVNEKAWKQKSPLLGTFLSVLTDLILAQCCMRVFPSALL